MRKTRGIIPQDERTTKGEKKYKAKRVRLGEKTSGGRERKA